MARAGSKAIPDKPKGKQLEHYVNGKDNGDGMHPGIRSKCPDEKCKAAWKAQAEETKRLYEIRREMNREENYCYFWDGLKCHFEPYIPGITPCEKCP